MNRIMKFCLSIVLVLVAFNSATASGGEERNERIAEGGRLYDKWWKEYNLKAPSSTHPAYPNSGKKSGATTWRCKECHGWDYRGNNGAYRKGSHYTGIMGIEKYANKSTQKIVEILKDRNHQYDTVMLDRALHLIALFVSEGQVDSSHFINAKSKKVKGDIRIGKTIYADKCARCHGEEGKDMNFGDVIDSQFVGTVAKKNPWEALHKIYNGHPGSRMKHMGMHGGGHMGAGHHMGRYRPGESMPAMRGELSAKSIKHLLSYMQTLPTE